MLIWASKKNHWAKSTRKRISTHWASFTRKRKPNSSRTTNTSKQWETKNWVLLNLSKWKKRKNNRRHNNFRIITKHNKTTQTCTFSSMTRSCTIAFWRKSPSLRSSLKRLGTALNLSNFLFYLSNEVHFNVLNETHLDEESVEELFKMWRLFVMASADEEDGAILKFYMYAKHVRGGFICIEVQIDKKQKQLSLTTKACH